MRTPCSAIVGALAVLKDFKLTHLQSEMVGIISSGASEILTLVEDALSAGLTGYTGFKVGRPH